MSNKLKHEITELKMGSIMVKIAFILIIVFLSSLSVAHDSIDNYVPEKGVVPDKITAIRVAEAIWLPIYGEGIYDKRPFMAGLEKGIWIVYGTLPKGMKGGVPVIEISKSDGKILRISHGK